MDDDDRIIYQVYEAANNVEYWEETSRNITELVDGGSVHLLLASLDTGDEYLNLFAKGDPSFASQYLRDYAETDFRVPRVMARKLGSFMDEREYVSTEEARVSPIHQELLPQYRVHNISGANMSLEGCIGWFGISTRDSYSEFDSRRRRFLEQLSPHIANALRIVKTHHELNLSREMTFASVDVVSGGVLIFHGERLAHANSAAQRFLDDGFFTIRSGQLACNDPLEQAKLAAFLRESSEDRALDSLLLRHYEMGAAYTIRIHELFPQYRRCGLGKGSHKAISIVEMNLPAEPSLDEIMVFCSGYGVSNSEARVVHAVVNSINLAKYAESRGISLYTVQQQLKSAMSKMDLNNQKKIFQAYERYRIFSNLSE